MFHHSGKVHLAEARDDEPELEKPVEIEDWEYLGLRHGRLS